MGGHAYMCVYSLSTSLPRVYMHSPYYIIIYVQWRLTWLWKFTICKQEYGPEEYIYLTRKKLGMSEVQWQVRELGWFLSLWGYECLL